MPAIASTVFKIKATADYIAPSPDILSFRKGQPFYALAADYERGVYHVSTQYATPFARNAVAGVVPMALFVQVDLMSKDDRIVASNHHKTHQARAAAAAVNGVAGDSTQIQREQQAPVPMDTTTSEPAPAAPARRPSSLPNSHQRDQMMATPSSNTTSSQRMDAQWSQLVRVAVNSIEMLSLQCLGNNIDVYRMRVCRGEFAHIIARTTLDLIQLHKALLRDRRYSVTELPSFPVADFSMDATLKQQRVEHYLNHLVQMIDVSSESSPFFDFLKPKHENECMLSRAIRRDSGFDDFEKDTSAKNRLFPNRKASLTTGPQMHRKQNGNSFFTHMFSHS